MHKLIAFILDIFYPKRCVNCGKFGLFLCFECAGKIEKIKTSTCPECGKITKNCAYCESCKSRTKTALNGLFIASRYDVGPVKEMIHNFKYLGVGELSEILGELLIEKIKQLSEPSEKLKYVVVPVPLHKKRENERGFNQAELIARYVSTRINLPGGAALARTRYSKSQVGLKREERLKNIKGIFECQDKELIAEKCVLLIDDVVTTGGTLNECAKVLKSVGAKKVYGLVVAKRV